MQINKFFKELLNFIIYLIVTVVVIHLLLIVLTIVEFDLRAIGLDVFVLTILKSSDISKFFKNIL